MGEGAILPVLNNLRIISIRSVCEYSFPDPDDCFPLLFQFLKLAPNLQTISVDGSEFKLELVTTLLEQVHRIKPNVRLRLSVSIRVPPREIDDVKKFTTISRQFKIFELMLKIETTDIGEGLVYQTLHILEKWLEKLAFVSRLAVIVKRCDGIGLIRDVAVDYLISLPLHSLAKLQTLEVFGFRIQVVKGKLACPPVLTRLSCQNYLITKNSSFFGCIFPNVKCAEINLTTDEEIEKWPLMLPNVEDLKITSESLEGIFGFSKLRKLDITIRNSNTNFAVNRLHWKYLTGGAKYIPRNEFCNSPVIVHKTLCPTDSFRNLPFLSELSFSLENIDCWKGVIYASRTGTLRRLRRLDFSFDKFELKNQYQEVLLQYHDSVNGINQCNPYHDSVNGISQCNPYHDSVNGIDQCNPHPIQDRSTSNHCCTIA